MAYSGVDDEVLHLGVWPGRFFISVGSVFGILNFVHRVLKYQLPHRCHRTSCSLSLEGNGCWWVGSWDGLTNSSAGLDGMADGMHVLMSPIYPIQLV